MQGSTFIEFTSDEGVKNTVAMEEVDNLQETVQELSKLLGVQPCNVKNVTRDVHEKQNNAMINQPRRCG